jgi:outer membrane lipoprotein LolB
LHGNALAGDLQLTTPLGSVVAQARWQPGNVELVTGEGTHRFADLDSVAQELLGQSLPLAALIEWLRGRPWPGAPSIARDGGFDQLGWRIDLTRLAEGWVIAARDSAPALSVRARLEQPG